MCTKNDKLLKKYCRFSLERKIDEIIIYGL